MQKSQRFSGLSALGSVVLTSSCATDCHVKAIAVSGNTVFAGAWTGVGPGFGIKSIGVSNKSAPSVIGTLSVAGSPIDSLSVSSNQLVASSGDGLLICGLSDPANPNLRDSTSAGVVGGAHVLVGSYSYFLKVNLPRGIVPVNISDPDNLAESSTVSVGTALRIISASTSNIFT